MDEANTFADETGRPLVGKTLGHYELISLLGVGGMGEVYRARDANLGREVAIKVLPSAFSEDADRLRRFEQEARAVGMLNHPNILTIHDVGSQEGTPYLVSELLEGETLRNHLLQGALPVRDALDYGLQAVRGLSAAHDKGIVHRDLKPENIFITKDGRVKILDFGLAKLTDSRVSTDIDKDALTTLPDTERGVIMGTVGYMSPEQVRGEEADSRSDIFAFGAILFEMLTGKRAFKGKSTIETMNSILKDDPPDLMMTNLSPTLERVIRHCLEKRPEKRFQSTNDLSFDIETLTTPSGAHVTSPVQTLASTPFVVHRARRESLAWIVASILLVTTLAALANAYFRRPQVEVRAVRSFILPPLGSSPNTIDTNAGSVALSPDGRRLAFVARTAEGKSVLWTRALDELSAPSLTGTEGASFPFWSPDSRSVGFFADGKLKKIDAGGGPTLTLCDAPLGRGGTWNRDGMIVFAPDSSGVLKLVSGSGGPTSAVTDLGNARSGTTHRWPYFLPDGHHFLYLSRGATVSEAETGAIYVASLESKESKLLFRVSSNVAYANGYLLFLRESTLMAQAFDAKHLQMVGEAFPIAEQVQSEPSIARGAFCVSENGVLAYETGTARSGSRLAWFGRDGKQLGVLGDLAIYGFPQLSPDGKKVTVTIVDPRNGNQDVWLYDVERGLRIRFTVDPADERSPAWSPDGNRIVFASNRKGHFDLYQKASNGMGSSDELLLESDIDKYPTSWSPDGQLLLYYSFDPTTRSDLWVLPMSGDRKTFPFLRTEFNEADGQFSPNRRWIAYTSDESGRQEVYVASFPGPGGIRQISTAGGRFPKWRPDAKQLFYLSADHKLVAAEVNGQGATLEVGAVRELFEVSSSPEGGSSYELMPNGQRFLVNTSVEKKASSPITLVINWTADLKR